MSKINADKFFIDGAWVAPIEPRLLPVINPATEAVIGQVALGSAADVDRAVKAARAAFPAYAATPRDERIALLTRIVDIYKRRLGEMGAAISEEMGAPSGMATKMQAAAGMAHLRTALAVLKTFPLVPKGVFNLINGDGPGVGAVMAAHPGIDVISFTGSTRAGIDVAIKAAPTVKRVGQELGGKSPNIILDDADLAKAVTQGVQAVMRNSGQSCNAPTRMLVPAAKMADAAAIAKSAAEKLKVGDPNAADTDVGPVVSKTQWDKIQALIASGIKDGATVAVGGAGRPDGLTKGYYVKPTVFSGVDNAMTIAREEIFGPVLVLIPYKDEADAVRIANDTDLGLAAYVQSADVERAKRVARRLRAGMVHINGAFLEPRAPFGGYKQSGNGREWGRFGFEEYLETKAVAGWSAG